MFSLSIIISTLLVTPFLFPRELSALARRLRYHIRNDLRKRLTDEQWNEIKHEFDDL